MLVIPGYRIDDKIYESSQSALFRGIHEDDDRPVILKRLNDEYPTPQKVVRFRREYAMTRDLDLDCVVKTFGLEEIGNTLAMILEDFGGQSLDRSLSGQRLELPSFLALAVQIAMALGEIHQRQIMHKDINPSNIVWNQDSDQVKVIDFGISTALPREEPAVHSQDVLEGTLAYISPEQTGRTSRATDYRTDLYSLGVVFYELLAGQRPFMADDPMELVHAHLAKEPTPPCEFCDDIPPTLSAMVTRLLAKEPEGRYQNAFGLASDLVRCARSIESTGSVPVFDLDVRGENNDTVWSSNWRRGQGATTKAYQRYVEEEQRRDRRQGPARPRCYFRRGHLGQDDISGRFQVPQKLYGRQREIGALLAAFERASQGATEVMLVTGYAGIGKSSLIREARIPITAARGYFVSGKFDQIARRIPYSSLAQAFRDLIR